MDDLWFMDELEGLHVNRTNIYIYIRVREKSSECHNHKPQPFPDTKWKRKQTKPNKRKSNIRTKSTKISSLPQAR